MWGNRKFVVWTPEYATSMLTCQREKFFLSSDQHYLNCAYMSPLMRDVELSGVHALQLERDPSQVKSHHFFEGINRIRHLFAQLICGESQNVAVIPATSYGIATIANNLSLGAGDNIVLTAGQFPSNVYMWRRLSDTMGATIHTVTGTTKNWTQKILEAINYRTAVVSMGSIHWANGSPFDLIEISQRAHDVGACFIVDGTQSIGAIPFDVQKIKPDALVCAGYKWLMGPYGTALLYLGDRFLDGTPLEEGWLARDGSENFENLMNYTDRYRPGAARFDRGQTNGFAQTAMMIKALEQLLDWEPKHIQNYCANLVDELFPALRDRGYIVDDACFPHLFGVGWPEHIDHTLVHRELLRRNISVSVRGQGIRISPNVYNDHSDIDVLQDVLLSSTR